jgi:hypothetical protein
MSEELHFTILGQYSPKLPVEWKELESELTKGEVLIYAGLDSDFVTKRREILLNFFLTVKKYNKLDNLKFYIKFIRIKLLYAIAMNYYFNDEQQKIVIYSYNQLLNELGKADDSSRCQIEEDFCTSGKEIPILKGIEKMYKRLEQEAVVRHNGISQKRIFLVMNELETKNE